MKKKSRWTKVLTVLVCIMVLTYFGIQTYNYYADPLTTTVAYTYQMEESSPANGYLVRDEEVLPSNSNGLLRLSRSEGEEVSKGGKIAAVYQNKDALNQQTQIEELKTQIEQLQYSASSSLENSASLKLDNQISEKILSLQKAFTSDRLDSADESIVELRTLVLKRDYTYLGGDAASKIKKLQSELTELQSSAASSVKIIKAPVSGTYSAAVDGYETVLKPKMLENLKPSDLKKVQQDKSVSSNVGKLILGETWYYAAIMDSADAKNLTKGQTVKLRLTKGIDRDLTATVRSISSAEKGNVAVLFSSSQYLAKVTLLRQQSADVIRKSVSGIRVPADALRVNKKGVSGLYCVVGRVARFKPVNVIYSSHDYALVKAASNGAKDQFRSGDEVIATAKNLYNGKVVR